MKSKNFIISYELYPFDVMFSLGETDAVLFPKLKKHLPEDCWAEIDDLKLVPTGEGRMIMSSCGAAIIRTKYYPTKPEHFGHLQHEIFHAVEFLMERIGVKHSADCGEVYAYAIQYLTEKVYEKMKVK